MHKVVNDVTKEKAVEDKDENVKVGSLHRVGLQLVELGLARNRGYDALR